MSGEGCGDPGGPPRSQAEGGARGRHRFPHDREPKASAAHSGDPRPTPVLQTAERDEHFAETGVVESLLDAGAAFAEAGFPDPLIVRAKAEGLLPEDYPDTGLVEKKALEAPVEEPVETTEDE